MNHPVTYSSLIFCGLSIYTIDVMLKGIKKYIKKKLKIVEALKVEKEKLYYEFDQGVRRTSTKHHGFAFSKEEENIPYLTQQIAQFIVQKTAKLQGELKQEQ